VAGERGGEGVARLAVERNVGRQAGHLHESRRLIGLAFAAGAMGADAHAGAVEGHVLDHQSVDPVRQSGGDPELAMAHPRVEAEQGTQQQQWGL